MTEPLEHREYTHKPNPNIHRTALVPTAGLVYELKEFSPVPDLN